MIVYKVCSVDEDGKRVSLYPFGRILEYPEGVDIVPVEGDGPIYAYKDITTAMEIFVATNANNVDFWECNAIPSNYDHGWYVTEDGVKVQPTYMGWRHYTMVMCDSVRLIRRIGSRINGKIMMEREEAKP